MDASGDLLRTRGNEYGAVTGRPRRCGWLDLPLLRYAGMINGISWLVVTKLDVLDELAEIPVCVGYKINGKVTAEIPAHASGYDAIECVYHTMPGWRTYYSRHHPPGKTAPGGARISGISRERERRPHRNGLDRTRTRADHVCGHLQRRTKPIDWTENRGFSNNLTKRSE